MTPSSPCTAESAAAGGWNFKAALTELETHLQQTVEHGFPTSSLEREKSLEIFVQMKSQEV